VAPAANATLDLGGLANKLKKKGIFNGGGF